MESYSIDKIAEDVRIALDRNRSSDALAEIGDIDTLTIDEIIKSKIVEGVKRVHSTAPIHLLDAYDQSFGDNISWGDKGNGKVALPNDFMRFICFKMNDWVRPVYHCMTTDDVEYEKQSSRFKGIRGTAQNPKCFISVNTEGRVLEFYSSKDATARIEVANYIPYPKIEDKKIMVSAKCYDAVIYTIAALVLLTFGDAERSNVFNELSKSALI